MSVDKEQCEIVSQIFILQSLEAYFLPVIVAVSEAITEKIDWVAIAKL